MWTVGMTDEAYIVNSWGADWGDRGYIYMKRNVGTAGGICGIATQACTRAPSGRAAASADPGAQPVHLRRREERYPRAALLLPEGENIGCS